MTVGVSDRLRAAKSFVGHRAREARLLPTLLKAGGGRGRIAFLPSDTRKDSALLRAYQVADGLAERGFKTIVLPKQLEQVQRERILRRFRPDIVVLQTCRHPLNRQDHLDQWRVVLDLDDADFLDDRLSSEMAVVARHAAGVISGSRFIDEWARRHCARTTVIWTGNTISNRLRRPHADRDRIVTWAQANPIACPDEFSFVADIARRLHHLGERFKFRLYGWPDGATHPITDDLRANGLNVECLPRMPYDAFLSSLEDVAVGWSVVLPTHKFGLGKSFGKILGYLDAKVPVICSDAVDHGLFFSDKTGLVSNDPSRWLDQTTTWLGNAALRQNVADQAFTAYRERLSLDKVLDLTESFISRILSDRQYS